jgi:hypothetical protein
MVIRFRENTDGAPEGNLEMLRLQFTMGKVYG